MPQPPGPLQDFLEGRTGPANPLEFELNDGLKIANDVYSLFLPTGNYGLPPHKSIQSTRVSPHSFHYVNQLQPP